MGQQTSKKNSGRSCDCGCGAWERHGFPSVTHIAPERWSTRECRCSRRRSRRPPCVCTGYRRVSDTCHDERLAAVLTLGSSELRREIDAIVLNTENGEAVREHGEAVNAELYVLSVAPRQVDGEAGAQEGRPPELQSLQNVDNIRHIQVRAYFVRAPLPAQTDTPPLARVHTQVDYIHCLVPDLREITACSFYWGKMDRYEAERLLDNKPEGTFLLRDSAQEEHLFSVSFRKYGRSLHARIEHFQRRFSFDSHDPAVFAHATVTGLIEHYKDPNCVMFFEPMLTAPLPRREPFALQQLARAVVVSSTTYDGVEKLPLPPRLRAYLKEYHYRQRVRTRRLEPDHYAQPDHAF